MTSTEIRTDDQLQQIVQDELDWSAEVGSVAIRVAVEHGAVTLSGEVEDRFEQRAAERAARRTVGVTSVVDHLVLRSSSSVWAITDAEIERRAADAITLHTTLSDSVHATADGITVTVTGSTATLSGHVRSFSERTQAERAAWSSPHVTDVHDGLTVTG
jgi:osmotically-inducible protein OsmY